MVDMDWYGLRKTKFYFIFYSGVKLDRLNQYADPFEWNKPNFARFGANIWTYGSAEAWSAFEESCDN